MTLLQVSNLKRVFGGLSCTNGIAWSPAAFLGVTVSRWRIEVRDLIATLTDQAVFTQFGLYGNSNIRRADPDPLHPDVPGPILAVLLPTSSPSSPTFVMRSQESDMT